MLRKDLLKAAFDDVFEDIGDISTVEVDRPLSPSFPPFSPAFVANVADVVDFESFLDLVFDLEVSFLRLFLEPL